MVIITCWIEEVGHASLRSCNDVLCSYFFYLDQSQSAYMWCCTVFLLLIPGSITVLPICDDVMCSYLLYLDQSLLPICDGVVCSCLLHLDWSLSTCVRWHTVLLPLIPGLITVLPTCMEMPKCNKMTKHPRSTTNTVTFASSCLNPVCCPHQCMA